MPTAATMTRIWLSLLSLTLFMAAVAESGSHTWMAILGLCLAMAIKGHWVVDYLMGLKGTDGWPRPLLLAWFRVLALLIFLAWLFPEPLRDLTSL